MMKSHRRLLLATALLAVPATFALRQSASAAPLPTVARFHLALSKAEPAINDTVATSPKAIKLYFTETVQASATGIKITGPDAHDVALGAVTIDAAAKSPAVAEVKETLKPGKYTVDWKTLAADGHPNKGTFAFTIGTKAAK